MTLILLAISLTVAASVIAYNLAIYALPVMTAITAAQYAWGAGAGVLMSGFAAAGAALLSIALVIVVLGLARNPKGYVPTLVFDDGEVLTENTAILAWVADRAPHLAPAGPMGKFRLIETLSFIACEIHKRFPIYLSAAEETQASLRGDIVREFELMASRLKQGYLFGVEVSVADFYLFVMARGARELGFPVAGPLDEFISRISARPSVIEALRRETGETLPGGAALSSG